MSTTRDVTTLELSLTTEQALDRLAKAAEEWGASWQREGLGGRLDLPIAAGLRNGWQRLRVVASVQGSDSCRLEFELEEEALAVHRPAVAVLLLAAFGALVVALWPFFPRILPIAPIAAVLAVVGWLMVGARLRHCGLREFLEHVGSDPVE